MTTRQLTDGDPSGTVFGQDSSDLIAFYGGTPTAKGSLATLATAATIATAVASVQEIIAYLRARGFAG